MVGNSNLTARAVKGAAWIGGGAIGRLIIRMVAVAILARLVDPEDYGIATASLILVEFAIMLGSMGLPQAIIQRQDLEDRHISAALTTTVAAAILLSTVFWFLAPFFALVLTIPEIKPITKVIVIMVMFRMFGGIFESVLIRQLKTREVALASIISWSVAGYLIAIPMAYEGFGYWSIVAMSIGETICWCLALMYFSRKLFPRLGFELSALRDLLPLSVGYAVTAPFTFLFNNTDRFLLARMLGAQELGLYSRASFLSKSAASLFNGVIRTAALSSMARVQNEPKRLKAAIRHGIALTAALSLPVGAFFAVFSEEIVLVLLGSQWTAAAFPFAVYGMALYPILGCQFQAGVFQATGRPYRVIPYLTLSIVSLTFIILLVGQSLNTVSLGIGLNFSLYYLLLSQAVCRASGLSLRDLVPLHVAPMINAFVVLGLGAALRILWPEAPALLLLISAILIIGTVLSGLVVFLPAVSLGQTGITLVRRVLGDRAAFIRWPLDAD